MLRVESLPATSEKPQGSPRKRLFTEIALAEAVVTEATITAKRVEVENCMAKLSKLSKLIS